MPPATFSRHFSPAALLFCFSSHNFRVNRILFLNLNCSIVTEHHYMSHSECHGVSRLYITERERKWSRVVSPMVRLQLSTGSYLSALPSAPVGLTCYPQSSSPIGQLLRCGALIGCRCHGACQDQDQDLGQPDPLEKGSRTRAKTKAFHFYCF